MNLYLPKASKPFHWKRTRLVEFDDITLRWVKPMTPEAILEILKWHNRIGPNDIHIGLGARIKQG